MEKINVLIIDPVTESRMRLRQATTAVVDFGTVTMFSDIESARERLSLSAKDCVGVVFLSHNFAKEKISEFINEAKAMPAAQDSAFVMLLKDSDGSGSSLAANMLMGGDGFLIEPYSVDKLRETTLLAARVKKDRSQAREISAISMLVNDLAESVNALAMVEAGSASGMLLKQLKDKVSTLHHLSDELKQAYFNIALDKFEALPAPKRKDRPYKGASTRTKARVAKKAAESIEEKLRKE